MKTFDVYIITYTETNGESNFRRLQTVIYPKVKRIDNIKGRHNAYAKIFQETDAEYVYIVHGDHSVHEDFVFSEPQDDSIHVWPSINRSNQQVSYNSSIKLFPVAPFKDHEFDKVDPLLGIDHKIVLESTPASNNQWDYNDFSIFFHVVRENIILRVMIDKGVPGAREEYNKWQEWDFHPPFSKDNIQVFWEFAETLNPDEVPEDFFNDYDLVKKMFVESFIKTEINAK